MSFYDVTHKYIQDKELRRQGGYLGVQRRQDLKPEISAAVFATKPPQLLKPIVKAKGISLILVEEIIQRNWMISYAIKLFQSCLASGLRTRLE
ncbi:chaperone SurA [Microcystis aeruginosa NIES-4325]|uniref:Chaperone SurA n=1 Tax=Microcystis aeruginosa NIES-4325 TaxID=2569534 RepID=A0A5J4FCC8_MICAE|nr:peptidylprolyl isomerase [Microcystis aeruginosa]GEA28334.1 chaperone SurA [Microcystis aeruginosa NIES-4325]